MFDGLLGCRFSAKCKQSIKCIRSRISLIRKKKHAMLNFLKKDIADLLANAHEANAFGRMDVLIVEMNQIYCYDTIDIFCEHILLQLPCLQKHKECPQEDMEAVATLIFAAARFSDLPELCDLRRLFTARYGSSMDTHVNAGFVDKNSTKTFSKDKKVKLMQDIVKEFSVQWDCKDFGQKKTNIFVQEQSRNDVPLCNEKEEDIYSPLDQENEIVTRVDMQNICQESSQFDKENGIVPEDISYDGCSVHALRGSMIKQEVLSEAKDIHMISNSKNYVPVKRIKKEKIFDDEPEKVVPYCTDTISRHKPRNIRKASYRDDQLDAGIAYNRTSSSPKGLEYIDRDRCSIRDVKNNGCKIGTLAENYHENSANGHLGIERSNDDVAEGNQRRDDQDGATKVAPKSVRKKHPRPQAPNENCDGGDCDEPTGGRNQSATRSTCLAGNEYDEEDVIIDKPLAQYSRKGMCDLTMKPGTMRNAHSVDHNIAAGKVEKHESNVGRTHSDMIGLVSSHGEANALSLEPTNLGMEVVDASDLSSARCGGCVHPRLPDYDQLAARFNALKKSWS